MSHRSPDPPGRHVTGPLGGVRVVGPAGIGPGPFAAMLLAGPGADVVRVDRPGPPPLGGDRGRRPSSKAPTPASRPFSRCTRRPATGT